MKFRRVTENNTLIPGILTAFEFYPDVLAFRVEAEGRKGQRRLMPKGIADILGVRGREVRAELSRNMLVPGALNFASITIGHAFAVETKASHRPKCKCESCTAQREWRAQWEKRGGIYVLARTVQDAVDGVLRNHE